MQQVFELFDKWAHRKSLKATLPAQPPRLLNFDFVGDESFGEPETAAELHPISSCLGRTESCLSSTQLSDSHCLEEVAQHQSSNVVYLQQDARAAAHQERAPRPTHKVRRYQNPKVRATAMLDASDLLDLRQRSSAAYTRFQPEQTASKQVSLEVLRRLGQRSSREEMLEKIKDACEKVSAEALINSPGRRPQTGPLRQTICIQIGKIG